MLPLSEEALPESIRKFGSPGAPEKARLMAAKGLVPIKGHDLIALLLQLSNDTAIEVSLAAKDSLNGLPIGVVTAAAGGLSHPAFLDHLTLWAEHKKLDDLLETLVGNPAISDDTLIRLAYSAGDRVTERIALNEARLLQSPKIIESLYKNKLARMSTVDRLVDLCVRNNVELEGVATFKEHADAISGQLLPVPEENEVLPSDVVFKEAVAADSDADVIEVDKADDSEKVKDEFKPLSVRIFNMSLNEKLRMCLIGNAAARALLVRDNSKLVAMAAVSSPQMTDKEGATIANSRQVGEDVLRYIGNKREWHGNYEVKRALVFNPKTPLGITMKFLTHLHTGDLKTLAKSKGIPATLKQVAIARLVKKEKQGG